MEVPDEENVDVTVSNVPETGNEAIEEEGNSIPNNKRNEEG